MQAEITYVTSCTCTWCEKKEVEGVEIAFHSGLLKDAELCFKCSQQALRVDHKQSSARGRAQPTAKEAQ